MATRTCDSCGKSKKVQGGKTCEKGHFICSICATTGFFGTATKQSCPLCGNKLR